MINLARKEKPLSTFQLFANLPKELQLNIWALVPLPGPRLISLIEPGNLPHPCLHACSDSRSVALAKHIVLQGSDIFEGYFNPDRDVLFIDSTDIARDFISHMSQASLDKIRFLAVDALEWCSLYNPGHMWSKEILELLGKFRNMHILLLVRGDEAQEWPQRLMTCEAYAKAYPHADAQVHISYHRSQRPGNVMLEREELVAAKERDGSILGSQWTVPQVKIVMGTRRPPRGRDEAMGDENDRLELILGGFYR